MKEMVRFLSETAFSPYEFMFFCKYVVLVFIPCRTCSAMSSTRPTTTHTDFTPLPAYVAAFLLSVWACRSCSGW